MKKLLLLLMLIILPISSCTFTYGDNEFYVPGFNQGGSTNNQDGITDNPTQGGGTTEKPDNPTQGGGTTEEPDNPTQGGGTTEKPDNPTQGGGTTEEPDNPTQGGGTTDEPDNPTQGGGTTEDPKDPEVTYSILSPSFDTPVVNDISEITREDFFNLGNRIDIKVTISNQELRKLQSDYETGHKSEIYRLASKVVITLKNNNKTYSWEFENVGIRQKGNTSRTNILDGNGEIGKNHFKLSFDETFDDPEKYDSDFISKYGNSLYSTRDFLGMSGLDFKWDKNDDVTHIREVYANYLYRACGILVQYSGLSTFMIKNSDTGNERSMGLCTVYQPSSKSMVKDNLKSDVKYLNMSDWATEKAGTFGVAGAKYGDLYKCSWGTSNQAPTLNNVNGNVGVGNISGSYIPLYDRKTNKDVDYNDAALINVSNVIRSGNYNEIAKYVDIEYLAMCEAVGFVVGNPDSMRYNSNNYMVYIRRTDGKMIFIPIDNDRCFGITKDWNPRNANMTLDMLERKNSSGNNTIDLLLNTVLSKTDNEAKTLYIKFCNMIKDSQWVLEETFNTYYNKAKNSYGEYYFSLDRVNDNETFKTYINNKVRYITNPTTGGNGNNNDNENNNQQTTDIYLVSNVNDWYATDKYKLTKVADNTYSVTFTVTKLDMAEYGECVKFKFNGGGSDYSKLDWSVDQNTQRLVAGGSSYRLYNVKVGDVVSVTINTSTDAVQIEIN